MRFLIVLLIFTTVSFASLKSEIEEGVSFYKHKQYERALEIFDRILIMHPNSKRVRLEYARVLYAMGRYNESKKEFLTVLRSKNLPPLVIKNIKWFLKKIERKQKKNFFSASLSIGTVYDNNIENKSDNPMYGGFVDSNREKRKDKYITKEFSLTHKRRVKNGIWKNSLYFYDELDHDDSKDRISYLSLSSSYKFLYKGLRIVLPINLGYTDIDKERYLNSIAIRPKIDKKLSKNSLISYSVIFEKNHNKDDDERSNKVYGASVRLLTKIKKFSNILGLGYKKYKRVNGDRLDVAKKRLSMKIGTSYSLLPSNLVNLLYKKTKDTYKEEDPTIKAQRVDKMDRYNLNFQQNINKKQYFQISFSKVKNKSNLDIYSYEKKLYSFKVTQKF